MTRTLREDVCTFTTISCWILVIMRNVSDKNCRENFMLASPLPATDNRAVYEIMWKNIVQPVRPQMTIWRMRIECVIPKTTNTHPQYATLIVLPLRQWLHERACLNVTLYVHCVSCSGFAFVLMPLRISWCCLRHRSASC
jgi:hypothetical protein